VGPTFGLPCLMTRIADILGMKVGLSDTTLGKLALIEVLAHQGRFIGRTLGAGSCPKRSARFWLRSRRTVSARHSTIGAHARIKIERSLYRAYERRRVSNRCAASFGESSS
jgi:hypothetical protein